MNARSDRIHITDCKCGIFVYLDIYVNSTYLNIFIKMKINF